MRVKAVQIARKLGISKATVSLALNGKPGVSAQTRREILECKELLEKEGDIGLSGQEEEQAGAERRQRTELIRVIIAVKGAKIVYDSEMDLWTDVLAVYDQEAKKRHYGLSVSYVDVRRESVEEAVRECEAANIAGVILWATELDPEDMRRFEKISKPMVIYDNESADARHHSIVADNYQGVKKAVEYLLKRKYRKLLYLSNEKDIYNFRQRRKGFIDALTEHNMNPYQDGCMARAGTTIDDVCRKMKLYLERHDLPEACIMENYQVAIGTMRALREMKIKVPEQISVLGIDIVPAYMTGDCTLTALKIPHTERALLTMLLLDKEIEEQSYTKSRVMTECRLIEGESVK